MVEPSSSDGRWLANQRWSPAVTHRLPRPVSAADGPISTNTCRPRFSTARIAARKFTGSPMWRTQYSWLATSAGLATFPVTADTSVNSGSPKRMSLIASRNSSYTDAISGEWKACDTASFWVRTPRSVSAATTGSSASRLPETTHCCGAFIAANDSSGWPSISGATSSAAAVTATMPPGRDTDCINRPRAATSVTASSSRNSPATVAATISPMLCPSSALGRTPQDSHSLARLYSSANSAGCVYRVWWISSSPSPTTSSFTDSPSGPANSRSHSSRCRRNTGYWR